MDEATTTIPPVDTTVSTQPPPNPCLAGIARGLALFLGGFSLLNLLGELRHVGFNANLWWIDLHYLPAPCDQMLLALAATALLAFALRPRLSLWRRGLTCLLTAGLIAAAVLNIIQFYVLLARGEIQTSLPVPFSLLICLSLLLVLRGLTSRRPPARGLRSSLALVITLGVCLLIFPLMQMLCFGKTDYRRPADAIVVFGARAYADGTPSRALADRVRTACQLYQSGLASKLVFSGGPGDGPVHETQAMRQMAISLGVPDAAIALDADGLNTDATVTHTAGIFDRLAARRILAVSHFYHLPRIKMTYRRAGLEVYTVPAQETYPLTQLPYNMAREIAALWVYYLRPLTA
jgi:vancomycin permeability regulator SanA